MALGRRLIGGWRAIGRCRAGGSVAVGGWSGGSGQTVWWRRVGGRVGVSERLLTVGGRAVDGAGWSVGVGRAVRKRRAGGFVAVGRWSCDSGRAVVGGGRVGGRPGRVVRRCRARSLVPAGGRIGGGGHVAVWQWAGRMVAVGARLISVGWAVGPRRQGGLVAVGGWSRGRARTV